ncbi:hypothetical protein BDY19DRAFT_907888 [Irpex rosettiformis]|uniref:Uncharacterized protein n=1 Tax=Irpex rosettiformis TaxID=378272 RepID=A0ACB8TYX7_9APHY|nr:hypothetical protein BDY19DRAFT_907888 [Irpex rosettiformis]
MRASFPFLDIVTIKPPPPLACSSPALVTDNLQGIQVSGGMIRDKCIYFKFQSTPRSDVVVWGGGGGCDVAWVIIKLDISNFADDAFRGLYVQPGGLILENSNYLGMYTVVGRESLIGNNNAVEDKSIYRLYPLSGNGDQTPHIADCHQNTVVPWGELEIAFSAYEARGRRKEGSWRDKKKEKKEKEVKRGSRKRGRSLKDDNFKHAWEKF